MKLNSSKKGGFTLVEIMIVVAIIGLLAAIAIPNFVKARATAQTKSCIANLRQIDGAKQQWAIDSKKNGSDTPGKTDLYGTTLYLKIEPGCPLSGAYTIGTVSDNPICSLSATDAHSL
jgi:prepilin-type N-terminal cleavage/methylation domain-containing protein